MRLPILLAAGLMSLVLAADSQAAVGDLTQKAGTAGCISETGTAGACVDGAALNVVRSVVVSPDGKSAYAAASGSGAVAIFDRDPATGALTQKPGVAGCISETGGGGCTDGVGLDSATAVALSPDGASVYVASFASSAVTVFDRNATTGALTQKALPAGCISETGAGGCTNGAGLAGASAVVASPDGANVYVASVTGDAVAVFDRNATTGALTQKALPAGCISETGAGGCGDGTAIDTPSSIVLSPDGRNAYMSASFSDAVSIFDRNPATGALTQKAGTAGCISETGTAGACADTALFDNLTSVTISPDGASAYVTASTSDALSILDRNPTTGELAPKVGTAGCISETGTGGTCADGAGLDAPFGVTVSGDGASAYVASQLGGGAVAILDRNPATGALDQEPGVSGCVSDTGAGGCTDGIGLNGAAAVTSSPGGANVYVAAVGSNALSIFDRDTPPQTTIDSGPSGLIADRSPTFGFSSSEAGSTFECRFDAAAFAGCSGPGSAHRAATLADGAHTFEVRAVDPAANPDPTPASRSFTVDATAPQTSIDVAPKNTLKVKKTGNASYSFSADEAGPTFRCTIDGGPLSPCSSPLVLNKLRKGRHSFSVAAADAAGNVDATPATDTFTVKKKKKRKRP